ncbi:MAG: DUF4292 domain-containing protein [Polyangiaceae bacterium]
MPRPIASAFLVLASSLLVGCPNVAPPVHAPPSAEALLVRMKEERKDCLGVQANAKLDHFGSQGRFRGDVSMFAARPARVRMDIVSPFGAVLATLTSDGQTFGLFDTRGNRFFTGPASACNIARLTEVPLPGHVLVDLLRGQAPVLRHRPDAATFVWEPGGRYVVTVKGSRDAVEEIALAPHPADFAKPFAEQRLRVVHVTVKQAGHVLYDAELDGHEGAPSGKERVDPDGIDPPLPPIGGTCGVELPRRLRVSIPEDSADVLFRYDQVTWNPPIPEGTFVQPTPAGIMPERVVCE